MARTDLTTQTITQAGLDPAYEAANVDGHAFGNAGKTLLHVKNGSASAVTVTVITAVTVGGRAVADDTISVPAAGERMIGPFPPSVYNGTGADLGTAHVDYSAAASVTVGAFTLA